MKLLVLLLILVVPVTAQAKPIDRDYLSREIKATLKDTGLYTTDIHNLLMGTAASETDFGQCARITKGPDLGLFQIEPSNHDDIWKNWLSAKPVLRKKVEATMWPLVPKLDQLRYNLRYQIIMAAVHYHRAHFVKKCLDRPKFKSLSDYVWWLAYVHKGEYNTKLGKSTTTRFFDKYHEYVMR